MNKTVFRAVFAVGTVVLLAIVAPVIWAAASAGLGLLAIGIIGAIGMGALQLLPYLGQKLENMVLGLRKSEARKNPIEQLQNYLKQKADRVAEFKQAVAMIGAQIRSLEEMLATRKRENPKYDASSREASIAEMKKAHAVMVEKYKNAEVALSELRVAIKDKEFDWKFSQAGQSALKSINAASGKDVLDAMLADEAFSSVTENFNKVFSELELEAAHLNESKQLTFDDGMTLDVSSISLPQKEYV